MKELLYFIITYLVFYGATTFVLAMVYAGFNMGNEERDFKSKNFGKVVVVFSIIVTGLFYISEDNQRKQYKEIKQSLSSTIDEYCEDIGADTSYASDLYDRIFECLQQNGIELSKYDE